MKLSTILLIAFLTLTGCQTNSNLKLPALIGDNMVLQQKTNAKIWGEAYPGRKITVTASWNSIGKAIAGKDRNSLNIRFRDLLYVLRCSAQRADDH